MKQNSAIPNPQAARLNLILSCPDDLKSNPILSTILISPSLESGPFELILLLVVTLIYYFLLKLSLPII